MNIKKWFKNLFEYNVGMLIFKGNLYVMTRKSILKFDYKTKAWEIVKTINEQ